MSDLLHSVSLQIIDNPDFIKLAENKINEIMKDNKITQSDIPALMVLVVECINNTKNINLTYDELKQVIHETLIYILLHFKVIQENNENINNMIKNCVELVMINPQIKGCFTNIWIKIKNVFLCKC
jgi:PII-like signaling protein